MKHIYIFVGTTAEFIKVAPIIKELKRRKKKYKLISTGQNNINFKEFEWYLGKIKPDIFLYNKSVKSSVYMFVIWAIRTLIFGSIQLNKELSDKSSEDTIFIVHGDTVSSMIGAIIAKIYGIKLAHVESGLRSFNLTEPFPEEIDRVIISKLADIHFAPNEWAVSNLKKNESKIVNTKQNTLYDIYREVKRSKNFMNTKRITNEEYFVLIVHRQEHVLFNKDFSKKLIELIIENCDLKCVLVAHEITKKMISEMDIDSKKVIQIERKPYEEFMRILDNAEFVATDGGSNQEELYYMGKPTLILRKVTERIEGLDENGILVGEDIRRIKKFTREYKKYKRKSIRKRHKPSNIIVNALESI